jgi:hypothetical protein
MTKTGMAAAAAVALLALTACGNDPKEPNGKPSGTFGVVTVNVDGRDVRCVTWKNGYAGGLDCDWEKDR